MEQKLISIDVTPKGVAIEGKPDSILSLDVCFDNRRIWSFSIDQESSSFHSWPQVLGERLRGYSDVEVRISGTHDVLFSGRIWFERESDNAKRFVLEDNEGRALMLNKWLRLAPALVNEGMTDHRQSILEMLVRIRDVIEQLGKETFVVGGTALGPYRDGDLLEFDDDGDIAVFFDTESPLDVARGMLRLQRELRAAGMRVRTHSYAHLQVYPQIAGHDSKFYVDVFAAFFKDGFINQPFHVRAPFRRDQLLPWGTIDIRGERFNVPNDIEAWFVVNYDENWATPQPGYEVSTPIATTRRFKNWFGTFNSSRHFWELYTSENRCESDYQIRKNWTADVELTSPTVLNLGAGVTASLPSGVKINRPATVVALEYADAALARLRQDRTLTEAEPGLSCETKEFNFLDYNQVLELVRSLPDTPFDLYSGFVIESHDVRARSLSLWRFVRLSLRSGGQVIFDCLETAPWRPDSSDPRSNHITLAQMRAEAGQAGLDVEDLGRGIVVVGKQRRSFRRVRVTLAPQQTSASVEMNAEGRGMFTLRQIWSKIVPEWIRKRISDRRYNVDRSKQASANSPLSGENEQMREELAELLEGMEELRSDQLRVAQVMDIVEDLVLEQRKPQR